MTRTLPRVPRWDGAEFEADRVEAWRLGVLINAGYPYRVAERLAARRDVDLHLAISMLEQGCAVEMAAEILL